MLEFFNAYMIAGVAVPIAKCWLFFGSTCICLSLPIHVLYYYIIYTVYMNV